MPDWVDVLLKVGPLIGAIVVGLLQLYLSGKFGEFRERMDDKLDVLEKEIERKYPPRDLIGLMFDEIKRRLGRIERKVDNGGSDGGSE